MKLLRSKSSWGELLRSESLWGCGRIDFRHVWINVKDCDDGMRLAYIGIAHYSKTRIMDWSDFGTMEVDEGFVTISWKTKLEQKSANDSK